MRAHFAGDVGVATAPTAAVSIVDAKGVSSHKPASEAAEQQLSLAERVLDFKQDSKNMEALSDFVDEVLEKAQTEALKQQQAKSAQNKAQPKEKGRQSFTIPDFKNGKVVNRARGLVVRIFDAICNCANSAAAPATRIKLRGKRSTSTAGNSVNSNTNGMAADNIDRSELKDKSKRDNGKEKKNEKKKKPESEEQQEQEQALLFSKNIEKQEDEGVKKE